MRTLITTALIAATALPAATLPTAASAQSRGELRDDRHDIHRDQRELRNDYRRGQYGDIRGDRADLRDARQEYREDLNDRNRRWGHDDWRGWRDRNRALYHGGSWAAPFRYYSFRPGVRIAPAYFGARYWIADPWRYRLPPAGYGQRWVRHYDDAILVDTRRGVVIDVLRGFYW